MAKAEEKDMVEASASTLPATNDEAKSDKDRIAELERQLEFLTAAVKRRPATEDLQGLHYVRSPQEIMRMAMQGGSMAGGSAAAFDPGAAVGMTLRFRQNEVVEVIDPDIVAAHKRKGQLEPEAKLYAVVQHFSYRSKHGAEPKYIVAFADGSRDGFKEGQLERYEAVFE